MPVARRTLSWYTDDDGSLVGTFRLAFEDGAVLVTAISAATERRRVQDNDAAREDDGAAGNGDDAGDPTLDPAGAGRADALVELAGAYLGQAEAGEAAAQGGQSADTADRYVVNIIAERRVLAGAPGEHPEGVCQIEHGPGLDPKPCAAWRARHHRSPSSRTSSATSSTWAAGPGGSTRALRRALARRDGGCQFPGCTTRTTQAHHVEHWIDGGPTRLSNLIELCSRHHHRHHEGAFRIAPGIAGGGSSPARTAE